MLRITVIIPNWNRRALVERLLQHLKAQTHPIEDILVVDNGSVDGSAETAQQNGARVIRMGQNAGFSKAVNRGIQESRTEWLAIVNNDVELEPDWLERLVEAIKQEDAWFATGKIFRASDRSVIDGTFDEVSRAACAWRAGNGQLDHECWSEVQNIRQTSFTAALFRAELFRRVGLLDERFESYLEDVDFGLRCAIAGFAGLFVPAARAYHMGSATLGVWHADTVRLISRNQILLIAKHYPNELLRKFAWPILVGQLLWGIVAFRHGRGLSFVLGKFQGCRLWRRMQASRINPETGFQLEASGNGSPHIASLGAVLEQSEQHILEIQKRTGSDLYWRLYFSLT